MGKPRRGLTGLRRVSKAACGYRKPGQRPRKRRRRRAEYGAAVVTALIEVWDIFEQPCGQRMVAVLRSELDRAILDRRKALH